MEVYLEERIAQHRLRGLYRQRRNSIATSVNFSDNDYLGLAKDPRILQGFKQGAEEYGVGGCSSQLVTGYQSIHQKLEAAYAEFLQRDAALLFTTGYMANCGVVSALLNRNDYVYADKEVHASLIDAIKLSGAKLKRFPHKNYVELERLLRQKNTLNKSLIITDSVFSLRGDIADLKKCATLAKNYNSSLMVDDAHGIGVLGATGAGVCEELQLSQQDCPILICPLAKAPGVMGAIVAGSKLLIDYLIQFARSYTYTTAIPPAIAEAALVSLELIQRETWRREHLKSTINAFCTMAKTLGLQLLASSTPIQCLPVASVLHAQTLSAWLEQCGFIVHAMRPPTVPIGECCLRITLTVKHSIAEVNQLLLAIKEGMEPFR